MNKILIFIPVIFISVTGLFAQQREISGKVRDENLNGLPGASVINAKSKKGGVTDANGNFKVLVDSTDEILISFMGYITEKIKPGKKSTIVINLKPNVKTLDQFVVTALGISRKEKSLGYSQQSVSTQELTEARDPNLTNALAGKVAGLQLISNGGPTSSSIVVLRGIADMGSRNDPIWVIDGVPVINNIGQQNSGSADDRALDYGNDIANLNPDMIDRIEILKGPNAAALYGSIAQNGAILITTKKGSTKNKIGITFNTNVMFHRVSEYPDYQNVYGAGHVLQTGREGTSRQDSTDYPIMSSYFRSWGSPMLGQKVVNYNGQISTFDPSPNNIKDYYQIGKVFTNTLSLDRSYETGSYRFSYSYIKGSDIVPEHNLQNSHSANLRAEKRFAKFLNINTGVIWANEKVHNRMYRNWSPRNPMNSFIYMTRNVSLSDLDPWKQQNGKAMVTFDGDQFDNPLWVMNEIWNEDNRNRFIGDITLSGEIIKNLTYRGKVNQDYIQKDGYEFNNWGADYDPDGEYRNFMSVESQRNYDLLLTYDSSFFSKKFTYKVNFGMSQRDYSSTYRNAMISSLILPDIASISNTASTPSAYEQRNKKRTKSVYGFINLEYKDMIFLDMTFRADWSSTLPKDLENYTYPSISTSILYSELLKLDKNILPFGKLRFSWAMVGSDTDPYQIKNTFRPGGIYNNDPWVYLTPLGKNPSLTPQSTTSFELGFDNRFFKDRLSFDVTLYKQNTKKQIVPIETPRASGFSRRMVNVGRVDNKGIEISAKITPIEKRNFTWDIRANWSRNINEVVELGDSNQRFWLGNMIGVNIYAEKGKPYGELRGTTQLYTSDGRPLMDKNSLQPIYTDDGYLGNAFPDWRGSVKNTFKYKNFDIGFLIDFQKGGTLYSVGHHKAQVWGNTISSLEGREDWRFSAWILGESDDERRGVGLDGSKYTDTQRNKGIYLEGAYPLLDDKGNYVYDGDGNIVAGGSVSGYMLPQDYWQLADKNMKQNAFDRSFIKLREVTIGYTYRKPGLSKLPFDKIRIAVAGRNLWTIFKNTPKGIDPESTSTVGNAQGVEFGSVLPTAYYGFDLKFFF